MNILCETEKLKLEFEQESVFLKNKLNDKILFEDHFYGNPSCGIIDSDNNWAIIAGIHLSFWKPTGIKKYQNEFFEHIHSLRIKDKKIVKILTDPWSINSSIWELNVENAELIKIKDFTEYKNKKYTEFVNW